MNITVKNKSNGLNGIIEIPPDKSISHRAIMLSSLCNGKTIVKNFSVGVDCLSTLGIIKQLGCETKFIDEHTVEIKSKNIFNGQTLDLDCGNSGTTMRLMSGLLAGRNINCKLFGDESLSKRPMKRVIDPLTMMGAKISHNDYKAPLFINGTKLRAINYESKLSSAQVKSCILLAGLNTENETSYTEPFLSRNHTELMLEYLGANISTDKNRTFITKSDLVAKDLEVPGDISSAAFFICAALITPNSDIILKNVGLNPTRTGIIDVIEQMGGYIEILDKKLICNELVGDIRIKYAQLKGIEISGALIPRLIDELPVIAVLASQADGTTIVKDAQDLRNKESDRIKCLVSELRKIGIDIEETEDGFIITGKQTIQGNAEVECYHDHRLAMSLYVAGLISKNPITINEFQWVDISFPEFLKLMEKLS